MRVALFFGLIFFASRIFSAEGNASGYVSSGFLIKQKKPNPMVLRFLKKQNQRKKIIASTLAFPLPFGFLGLHRIYLGTQPYIPLVYVGTLGGCAGILPMIDFCNLVSNKDISRFQANPHVFMWVDNGKTTK